MACEKRAASSRVFCGYCVSTYGRTAGMTPSMHAISQTAAPPREMTRLTSCSSLAMILVDDVTCSSATTGSM
eukprot:2807334-Prymnesium_polylepis.3